jgi:ABC-type uncharacterized transport system substrate-binding protein
MQLDELKRRVAESIARNWPRTLAIRACVGAPIFLFYTLGMAAADTKRVLMLHSFGRDFKPWSEYAKNIRSELDQQSPWSLEISDHSLMSGGFSDEDSEAPFVEYLRALHTKRPPDLIVSLGAPAVAFVQRHRHDLFAAIPMVFTAVEQRRIRFSTLTENDTVVAVANSFPAVFENILRVLPETKTVAVVDGNSPNEKFWLEEIRRDAARFANRIAFTWYNELSFEVILKQAAALPPQSAIFWHLMNVDAAGVVQEQDKALKRLYAVANAPIFSFNDTSFGHGIVGGPMHSVSEGSRLTASVAIRILGGEKAGDIRVPATGFATPKFDWREMRRWRISESRLMPGSEIYFRESNVWEQYRAQILVVCAVILLQSALICWLLYQRRRRRSLKTDAPASA